MAPAEKKARKTKDPAVILDLEWRDGMFLFRIWNRGDRPVTGLRVNFRRKLTGFGGAVDISALPIWSRLSFLPPGKVIDVPIDRAETFLARDRGTPLNAVVSYSDADGARWSSAVSHDFLAYQGMPQIIRTPDEAD